MGVRSSRILFWAVFVGSLAADQVVKALMRLNFAENQSATLIPGILDLRLTYNKGIAFGQLQGFGVYLAPVAIVIAIGAAVYTYRHAKETAWIHGAMGLLASGALGNMIDRLFLGRVTDMFETRFVQFPVFNVADACISVAAAVLIVKWGFESFSKPHTEATAAASPERSSSPDTPNPGDTPA